MKAPICDICLRSSILCSACNGKLVSGEISESDVNVSRAVLHASEKFKSLRGVTVRKVIDTPNSMILIPEKGESAKIIGKMGLIVKELSRIIGKNVRVIEETPDKREFIEKMIFPVKVSAINVLFTDEGEMLKVIVTRKPPISEEALREVVKRVYGEDIRLVNE